MATHSKENVSNCNNIPTVAGINVTDKDGEIPLTSKSKARVSMGMVYFLAKFCITPVKKA